MFLVQCNKRIFLDVEQINWLSVAESEVSCMLIGCETQWIVRSEYVDSFLRAVQSVNEGKTGQSTVDLNKGRYNEKN